MSHSNSTQYYNLPQFDSSDKPAWLTDVNPAYTAIDTGIHAAKAAADAAQSDATQALTDASTAGTAASGADAKATGSIASLADTFDTTATYNVGDLVIYNNLLYICIVDVSVPGAWTGSGNWNRTTIKTEINKKQNTLTEGAAIDLTSDTVSLDINGLTSVSSLHGTDELIVFDGTNTKKTTTAAVAAVDYTEGSSGVWHYKKYANGTCEIWGYSSQTMQPQLNSWGTWYSAEMPSLGAYPFTLTAIHSILGTVTITNASGFGEIKESIGSLSNAPTYIFARPTTIGVEDRTVIRTLYVRGTWA